MIATPLPTLKCKQGYTRATIARPPPSPCTWISASFGVFGRRFLFGLGMRSESQGFSKEGRRRTGRKRNGLPGGGGAFVRWFGRPFRVRAGAQGRLFARPCARARAKSARRLGVSRTLFGWGGPPELVGAVGRQASSLLATRGHREKGARLEPVYPS